MERELKKVDVTSYGMWEEYISKHPDGYKNSQFREYCKQWGKKVNPVMHMNHKAGDKMYVDYAGKKLSSKLFSKLKMAKADGSYLKELAKIEKQDVILLDDFGLQALDSQNRITLLEIIEDRHNKGSIIVTSQIPVQGWYDIIGEKTIADAVLDRLIHQAHRIELHGESMRKKKSINKE